MSYELAEQIRSFKEHLREFHEMISARATADTRAAEREKVELEEQTRRNEFVIGESALDRLSRKPARQRYPFGMAEMIESFDESSIEREIEKRRALEREDVNAILARHGCDTTQNWGEAEAQRAINMTGRYIKKVPKRKREDDSDESFSSDSESSDDDELPVFVPPVPDVIVVPQTPIRRLLVSNRPTLSRKRDGRRVQFDLPIDDFSYLDDEPAQNESEGIQAKIDEVESTEVGTQWSVDDDDDDDSSFDELIEKLNDVVSEISISSSDSDEIL